MAKYQQKHLEIQPIPVAVITINTIGDLPLTSKEMKGIWQQTVYIHLMCSVVQ